MHEDWKDRFEARVDKSGGETACWPWTGSRLPTGYGRFYPKYKVGLNAHRVAWEIANGRKLEQKKDVCHTCDNPPCCNPAHLFAGSKSDNMRDMIAKGRQGYTGRKGSKHNGAKLNEAVVVEIKNLLQSGESLQKIANRFGVTKAAILHIKRGRTWTHV